MSDIDTAAADSLKVLDPERPIREADIGRCMHDGDDRDLGASVAPHMNEVCDRLPVPVAEAALVRGGFIGV